MLTRETPTHSPAPFALDADGDVVDADGMVVAIIYTENDADRRMMQKAPELLAACRAFVRDHEALSARFAWADGSHVSTIRALVGRIDGTEDT
jgi:hypothetical protein